MKLILAVCCFICVTQWWALHFVIKRQFFLHFISSTWSESASVPGYVRHLATADCHLRCNIVDLVTVESVEGSPRVVWTFFLACEALAAISLFAVAKSISRSPFSFFVPIAFLPIGAPHQSCHWSHHKLQLLVSLLFRYLRCAVLATVVRWFGANWIV